MRRLVGGVLLALPLAAGVAAVTTLTTVAPADAAIPVAPRSDLVTRLVVSPPPPAGLAAFTPFGAPVRFVADGGGHLCEPGTTPGVFSR